MKPQVPIEVDESTGVWTTDGLPMLYVPRHFFVNNHTAIEEALGRVLEGVSGLLVVHRPSTLALADRVALIDGGRVAAMGTHRELLKSNDLYRALLSQEYEPSAEEALA